MKSLLMALVLIFGCRAFAQVEIVGIEPHSHVACELVHADDPWGTCLIVRYKNVSSKSIAAIRFSATFHNAMGDDSTKAVYEDTRKVKPGKTITAFFNDGVYWHQYGDKMTAEVEALKIMYEDGTYWVIH
jgi:hypothetical protein